MIELNHLNHNFIKRDGFKGFTYYKDNTYSCTKCNINIVTYEKPIQKNSIQTIIYYTLSNNPKTKKDWKDLNITCEEMIIKNIIE